MEITVQELAALDPKGYVLLDMRGSEAREYGQYPAPLKFPRRSCPGITAIGAKR